MRWDEPVLFEALRRGVERPLVLKTLSLEPTHGWGISKAAAGL